MKFGIALVTAAAIGAAYFLGMYQDSQDRRLETAVNAAELQRGAAAIRADEEREAHLALCEAQDAAAIVILHRDDPDQRVCAGGLREFKRSSAMPRAEMF